MLRETTSRGLCELVCPSRTSERGCVCVCVCVCAGETSSKTTFSVFITAVPILRKTDSENDEYTIPP